MRFDSLSPIMPALGWPVCAGDWRRIACRRPPRADLIAARRILDQVEPDSPSAVVDEVARSTLPAILRFFNALPDLTFLVLAEERGVMHLRCSRDLAPLAELVRASWSGIAARQKLESQHAPESDRIRGRRDLVHIGVRQLVETLIERPDLDVAVLWQIAGSNDVGEECSLRMNPDEGRRRIRWFAQHVLAMPVSLGGPSPMTRETTR